MDQNYAAICLAAAEAVESALMITHSTDAISELIERDLRLIRLPCYWPLLIALQKGIRQKLRVLPRLERGASRKSVLVALSENHCHLS